MISISIGGPKSNAQAVEVEINDGVRGLSDALAAIGPGFEKWWSGHRWQRSYRNEAGWLSCGVVVIDIDHDSPTGQDAPDDDVGLLCALVRERGVDGNLFHLTPHGARVAFVLKDQCEDVELVRRALRGACAMLTDIVSNAHYKVDASTSCDLARLMFTPNSLAKGVQRNAHVVMMNAEAYDVADLARRAPPEPVRTSVTIAPVVRNPDTDYATAVQRFNDEHPLDVERHSDTCPICGHHECFGVLPKDRQRWFCWSSNHAEVGVRSPKGWHGDALDLYAHENGVKPIDVLLRLGYLARREPAAISDDAPESDEIVRRRAIRNNSFDSACTLLEREAYPTENDRNLRDILRGRQIRFNEMTGMVEFGNWDEHNVGRGVTDIRDVDVDIIRRRLELLYRGGIDQNGNETGLKIARNDVERAVAVVADEHSYHPVRDYLSSLAWDCVDRIDFVVSEILGAEDSPLNRAMIRKTLFSAVVRVFEPGCKVDTMLVLQGAQGAMKSTFFKTLSAPWFVDTAIDINGDATRAYQVMRRAWLFEWAELETLLKARDFSTVKAFLSSTEDTYIAKYGRHPISIKRSGIIVGTINPEEFLSDETGARRFWPIICGIINLKLAEEWRDMLWAEAVAMYRAWVLRGRQTSECPWWLTSDEEKLIKGSHDKHRVGDAWEEFLVGWAEGRPEPFTTSDALKAVGKERKDWKAEDTRRVSKIFKAYGYERKAKRTGTSVTQVWQKAPVQLDL